MTGTEARNGNATRIVLFGDGAWAADTLARLHVDGYQVVGAVVRRRPSSTALADAARAAGVPVLQPAQVNARESIAAVAALEPALGLSVAYDQILGGAMRAVPPLGLLNVHAGRLPDYRGRNVLNWALANGEREIGITVHVMDDGIDTGDIVLQQLVPVSRTATYAQLLACVEALVPALAAEAVIRVVGGSATLRRQAHEMGSYFPRRRADDEWLDWSWSSERLHNLVRAITRPGPGARTTLDGQPVRIWQAYHDPAWPRYGATPGCVVGRRPDGMLVKTGDSVLLVQEAQVAHGPAGCPTWRVGVQLGVNVVARLQMLEERLAALEARLPGWEESDAVR